MPDHPLWKRNATWLLLARRAADCRGACSSLSRGLAYPRGDRRAARRLRALGTVLAVSWWDEVPGTPLWVAVVPAFELAAALWVGAMLARASPRPAV
jgi:hypothetical protein